MKVRIYSSVCMFETGLTFLNIFFEYFTPTFWGIQEIRDLGENDVILSRSTSKCKVAVRCTLI